MKANSIFDVLGGVVLIGMITAVVSSRNTQGIISSSGSAFSSIIAASLGKGSVA